MTYNIPAHGEPNWDGKLNPSLQYVKDTAEAAETPTGAQSKATAAQNAAISAAATDATNKANAAQNNAITSAASDATTKANAVQSSLNNHTGNVANPHSVTKAQIGLGNVDNTSDASKPVSTAAQSALDAKVAKGTLAFHVSDYGAVGDGVADDTTAIQSAFTAARPVKGRVRLGTGKTYIVSAALDPAGCRVEAHGATLKIKPSTTPTYSVLTPTDACTIDGLTIDGNKANTTDPANQLQGCGFLMNQATWDGLVLRNVTVKNCHQVGVHIYSSSGGTSGDAVTNCPTLLDGVSVTNCTVANYSIKTIAGVTVRNCRSTSGAGAGIYLSVVGKSRVTGCTSTGNSSGIFVEYGTEVLVEGNTCDSNTSQGIAIGGGSTTLQENRYITVRGNVCRNNGTLGITVDPTKSGSPNTWVAVYSTVEGNLCQGNGSNGINLENAGYVAVNNNVCHANTGVGLRIIGAYANVSGNVLTSNTTYGLAIYGTSGSNNGHHRFGGNTVLGNTTADFDLAQITSGIVSDVVTRIPGSVRGTGTVHGAADSAQEVFMGAAGPAGEAGIDIYGQKIYEPSTGILRVNAWWQVDGNLKTTSSAWNTAHFIMGTYELWIDASGRLRIKNGSPTSDTDGTVVGAQV